MTSQKTFKPTRRFRLARHALLAIPDGQGMRCGRITAIPEHEGDNLVFMRFAVQTKRDPYPARPFYSAKAGLPQRQVSSPASRYGQHTESIPLENGALGGTSRFSHVTTA
ncbi:hypothetical protein [Robbsia andropogonis]|uniref:hypothetical protein n=1 Tax=Robbsia andropogonis TaxID=28092 RepID=UPI00209DEAF7|nr:hypothetical protein [Robbsia andropogonis]MCP1117944.1 hypothetical protein [Robbsia andropogonis]MCP1127409.1 hypothetical protein [Robbsia andropogonis]